MPLHGPSASRSVSLLLREGKGGTEWGQALGDSLQHISAGIPQSKRLSQTFLSSSLSPSLRSSPQLDQRQDIVTMQDALGEITGGRTVPRVFINGKFLGGGDDTAAAAANGTLEKLLKEAGVL